MAEEEVVSETLLEERTEELLKASEEKLLEMEEKLLVAADRLLAETVELLIVDGRALLMDSELLDKLRPALELVARLLAMEDLLETIALLLEEGIGFGSWLFATELALVIGVVLLPPPQALNNPDMTKTLRIPRD